MADSGGGVEGGGGGGHDGDATLTRNCCQQSWPGNSGDEFVWQGGRPPGGQGRRSRRERVRMMESVGYSRSTLLSPTFILLTVMMVVGWMTTYTAADMQQQCPPRVDITPCSCTMKKNGLDVLCEFTDQQRISDAMGVLKGKPLIIFYLKLRHNQLRKLPGFVFLGLDIRHLTIHNSSLSVVEETSLSSIGKMLTQLDVSQNSLITVPSVAYKNLHQLLILNMNHNKISSIHARAFQGLDTLEILTLYENKITIVDQDAFVGLEKKLKRLNLGGNALTTIPQKALAILDTLKKLELQENRITDIKEGDFEGLRNLDSLGLAHNKLKEVPAKVFSHLTLLNSLELDGNHISDVDPEAFAGLEENLQYLRLGDNNIHTIPTEALRRLHRLRHLDLRSNNISVIAEDAFTGYGDSITFLNLQKNDIKTLPALAFENLNSLETLNLQNNKLMHIPEEIMEPIVDTLRVVDIMDNPLVCDCELQWYKNWVKSLRDKDDEMMQKKRTVCMMNREHREYSLQNLPLEKMDCVIKSPYGGPSNGAVTSDSLVGEWYRMGIMLIGVMWGIVGFKKLFENENRTC